MSILLALLLSTAQADSSAWCGANKSLVVGPTADADWRALLRNEGGAADRLVDFVEGQHITRVYLYVGSLEEDWEPSYSHGALPEGDSLSSLVAQLWGVGAEPVALWSLQADPLAPATDYTLGGRANDLIAAVDAFNAAWYPYPFIGVAAAMAPADPGLYDEHFALLAALRDNRAVLTWPMEYSARLPAAWLTELWGDAPAYEAALATVDHAVYDGFTDDRFRMVERGATFLTTADAMVVGGEVGATFIEGSPNQTFYEEALADPAQVYEDLGAVHEGLSSFAQYSGIGLTDYASAFAATHEGQRPQLFTGTVGGPCVVDPHEDTGQVEDSGQDTALQTEVPDDYPAPDYVQDEHAGPREFIGCGCSTRPAALPGLGLGAIGLLALRRRRR